jgi:hypothetical protein
MAVKKHKLVNYGIYLLISLFYKMEYLFADNRLNNITRFGINNT